MLRLSLIYWHFVPVIHSGHLIIYFLFIYSISLYSERKKHDALIKKQKEHAERMKDRREKIEKRIEMNMSMAEKIEEKRKNDFLDKQEHFERARMAHLMQQDQDRYVLTLSYLR